MHICVCTTVWILVSIRSACADDWSLTSAASSPQMVRIRMPAPRFFQAQLRPEWLSEILEGLEDRMRRKLVLLAKDNGTDTQLSNLISETCREHSDLVRGPRTCCVGRRRHLLSHVASEDLAHHSRNCTTGKKKTTLFILHVQIFNCQTTVLFCPVSYVPLIFLQSDANSCPTRRWNLRWTWIWT